MSEQHLEFPTDIEDKFFTKEQLEKLVARWEKFGSIEHVQMEYTLAKQLLATMKLIQLIQPYQRAPKPKFESLSAVIANRRLSA